MLETYWRKNTVIAITAVFGWKDELSENLEHVSSEVEPVVYSSVQFFSMVFSSTIYEANEK